MTHLERREHVVEQARLHHILHCISGLHFGAVHQTGWTGDATEGTYSFNNGEGDLLTLAWSPAGLVALVFDHELARDQEVPPVAEREPLRCLRELPTALAPLAERAADCQERLGTHGFWVDDARLVPSDPWGRTCNGIDMLGGFVLSAEQALFGKELLQSWHEATSVSAAQARLAIKLAKQAAEGPVTLTATDEKTLLKHPTDKQVPSVETARATAEALQETGVTWKVPEARLTKALGDAAARHRQKILEDDPRFLAPQPRLDGGLQSPRTRSRTRCLISSQTNPSSPAGSGAASASPKYARLRITWPRSSRPNFVLNRSIAPASDPPAAPWSRRRSRSQKSFAAPRPAMAESFMQTRSSSETTGTASPPCALGGESEGYRYERMLVGTPSTSRCSVAGPRPTTRASGTVAARRSASRSSSKSAGTKRSRSFDSRWPSAIPAATPPARYVPGSSAGASFASAARCSGVMPFIPPSSGALRRETRGHRRP